MAHRWRAGKSGSGNELSRRPGPTRDTEPRRIGNLLLLCSPIARQCPPITHISVLNWRQSFRLESLIFFSNAYGVSADKHARSLILYPIAARLGIGDALLLLIANRDSAEESRTSGFAGKQVALTVHQNGSLGCASGHGQYEGKDKYCSHN